MIRSRSSTIIGPGSPVPAAYDWAGIEADLSTALPPDYKLLCEAFSPGFREGLPAANLFVVAPGDLKSVHEMFRDMFSEEVGSPFPSPGGPLLCLLSESRDQIAWDTSDPDPARWPVIDADRTFGDLGFTVFPGNLTELIVAALTYGHGIRLSDSAPGDPAHWSFPFWGPDAPWTDLPGSSAPGEIGQLFQNFGHVRRRSTMTAVHPKRLCLPWNVSGARYAPLHE